MAPSDLCISSRMTYGDMRRYADTLDIQICSATLPKTIQGMYIATLNTIIIDRNITYTMKRCALAHELIHWAHSDSTCRGISGARGETRTRKQTATTLISAPDYALAEMEYEGDPAHIAAELDVTREVLEDYQTLLKDSLPQLQKDYASITQLR